MALSVALARERLATRRAALIAERSRIVSTSATELARVDLQLDAIGRVAGDLVNPQRAAIVDGLFRALDEAGLKLTVAE
jgi:hypothetical protein